MIKAIYDVIVGGADEDEAEEAAADTSTETEETEEITKEENE